MPIEERGGEVLEHVNEVFNLMAMKINENAKARAITGEKFHQKKPHVIYIKNPKDRLLMMTEQVD